MCGTMNYDVDLDETGGWTKCRLCKAVTCSMDEWKKHTVSVPLLNEKQLVARSITPFAVRKDTSKWTFVLLLMARSALLP